LRGGEANPFRIPSDSKIFTFRDEERAKKQEERKFNSKLKAWEKNKPERSGILRAIRDTDIEFNDVSINEDFAKQQKTNNISFDRIPVDTQKKKETRHDLLNRNKNIFLIAQMLSIKHDEIQKLEDFQTLRSEGLKFYENNLNTDIKQFVDYFKDNREQARQTRLAADNMLRDKQAKEAELKRLHVE
jgi:hypothetical protein